MTTIVEDKDNSSFIVGGQIDYNLQVGSFVLAVEADTSVTSSDDENDGANRFELIDDAVGPSLFRLFRFRGCRLDHLRIR